LSQCFDGKFEIPLQIQISRQNIYSKIIEALKDRYQLFDAFGHFFSRF
jgi:hypothetical protein